MPNFDCGGDGCRAFSCASCTDEKTRAEYWKVLSACRSDAEADRIMRERLAKKRLATKRCTRCDAALTCATCDERFDDLLKTVERLRAALADIARGDYSDPLCQRTPEQRARDALAGK